VLLESLYHPPFPTYQLTDMTATVHVIRKPQDLARRFCPAAHILILIFYVKQA
jgi:hypothetical protein